MVQALRTTPIRGHVWGWQLNKNADPVFLYFFTALHGIHLLGGLFFWGKVTSRIFKLQEKDYHDEEKNITALSIYWLFLFIVWFLVPLNLLGQSPIKMAHSHNDYLNEKPLLNALKNNFKSIEVDVFLLNTELYVGHNWLQLRRNKTIEKLYLDHLWEIYNENNGTIYENNNPLYLLVDFKTASDKTYQTLLTKLKKYKPMLTRVISDSLIQGAVTIIISGDKPSVDDFKKTSKLAIDMF